MDSFGRRRVRPVGGSPPTGVTLVVSPPVAETYRPPRGRRAVRMTDDDSRQARGSYWDRWAAPYSALGRAEFWLTHRRSLVAGLAEGSRVLEVCCGGGQLVADVLASAHDVYGLDRSAAMVEHIGKQVVDLAGQQPLDAGWRQQFAATGQVDPLEGAPVGQRHVEASGGGEHGRVVGVRAARVGGRSAADDQGAELCPWAVPPHQRWRSDADPGDAQRFEQVRAQASSNGVPATRSMTAPMTT